MKLNPSTVLELISPHVLIMPVEKQDSIMGDEGKKNLALAVIIGEIYNAVNNGRQSASLTVRQSQIELATQIAEELRLVGYTASVQNAPTALTQAPKTELVIGWDTEALAEELAVKAREVEAHRATPEQ